VRVSKVRNQPRLKTACLITPLPLLSMSVFLLLVFNTGVSDTGAMGINDGVLSE
jgi:hypothetical protein